MMVMIDPSNVRGAFTGGQTTQSQSTQDPGQPAPSNVSPAQDRTNADALSALESLVAESAQVTPQKVAQQTPQTVQQPEPVVQQTQPQPTQPVAPQPQAQPIQQQQTQPPQDQTQVAQQPTVQTKQTEAVSGDVTAQAVLSTMQSAPDPLNPPNPAPSSAKEVFERPAAPDVTSVDVGGAIQHVEVEKNPEIPTEVEGFLQRVEDFSAKPPQEVVIADGTNEQATANYPSRPVIVLPITQEEEKKGKNKSPRNSIRWLVEWSHKIVKMFAGKVIYRQVDEE